MATLWADNFYEAPTATTLDKMGYSSYAGESVFRTTSANPRRTGAYAIDITYNYAAAVPITPASTTLFFSFATKLTGNPSALSVFAGFRDSGDLNIGSLSITPSGEWQLNGGASSTTTTSGAAVTSNVWKWWIMKVVVADGTAGSIELRDSTGATIASITGIDTKPGTPANADRWIISTGSINQSGITGYVTDLHIWDGSGSICNTWTNETQIDTLLPNAAGDSSQWTPSAGANYECVDEAQYSTTDYVSTSGANTGYKDLYGMTNLSVNPVNIYSIMATAVGEKQNAGLGSIKLLCKSGSTTSTGSAKAYSAGSITRVAQVFEADPNTSAAWTQSGINAMQTGIEVA